MVDLEWENEGIEKDREKECKREKEKNGKKDYARENE